jgi:transposase
MPAPLRIVLNPEEERTLSELRVATSVPQRTKDRAHMLRLNAQGWQVAQIARCFECHEHTVRATIHRWESKGLSGLWEKAGRGMRARWQASDLAFLETCLEQWATEGIIELKFLDESGFCLWLHKKRAISGLTCSKSCPRMVFSIPSRV